MRIWPVGIVLVLIVSTYEAQALRLSAPAEVKGQLVGHLDRDPPVPVYSPDSLRLNYVESGGVPSSVNDSSGALTLVLITEILGTVASAKGSETLAQRTGQTDPKTLRKALAILKEWYKPKNNRPKTDEVLKKIERLEQLLTPPQGLASAAFLQEARDLCRLVGDEPNYPTNSGEPIGANEYFRTIKGSGVDERQLGDFIFNLTPASGASSPVGEKSIAPAAPTTR
ncbi:MAG: hypothetical protein IT288_08755 [Bdellovibrionales bacterium]|nr:hypothetical protein [Bdellovibrionales bacterium]